MLRLMLRRMETIKFLLIWELFRLGVAFQTEGGVQNHEWDHIIFTQHWPASVCAEWKSKGPGHSCALPKHNIWTIHGLWPTQTGSHGPEYCNSSLPFDQSALDPIIESLQENWINIDMPTPPYSFWKYEWKKHGTCAASLPELDHEFKYFSQGLQWLEKYNMAKVLSSCGFTEGNMYTAKDIWTGVKGFIGKIPTIHCFEEKDSKTYYLFEIRICFDKNLELIDCTENAGSHYLANCPESEVIYPSFRTVRRQEVPRKKWLLDALNLFGWLQWLTR